MLFAAVLSPAGPVAVLGSSLLIAGITGDEVAPIAFAIVVPAAQLITSMRGERAAMRRRAQVDDPRS